MRLIPLVVCAAAGGLSAAAVALETKDVPAERGAAAPSRPAVSAGLTRLAAVTKEGKARANRRRARAPATRPARARRPSRTRANPRRPRRRSRRRVPAKQLFGAAAGPAPLAARAIGSYAKGCLAGAQPLAVDGPAWQAMRLSRNRNWGHPQLIKLVERLAVEAQVSTAGAGSSSATSRSRAADRC